MKMMTSAYASKLLRQLDEEKAFHRNKEITSCTYVVAVGEEAVIPDYDYLETSNEIAAIDHKIQIIKHAINVANVNSMIPVQDQIYSVDTILVKMAQLSRRKNFLEELRKQQPKERQDSRSFLAGRSNVAEYKYINYDLERVKADYEMLSNEILNMQIALDHYNQTFEFEVEV